MKKHINNAAILSIILVSLACAVRGEHKKRDVHRIIIQERIPKTQHLRSHDVHHHEKRVHPKTLKKAPKVSSEESYEDSHSHSLESYEKPEKFISSKLKHFTKPTKSARFQDVKPDVTYHRTETKHAVYSDWVPLDRDPVAEHFKHSHTHSRHKSPKLLFPKPQIPQYNELTTHRPVVHTSYDPSPIYPLTMYSEVPNTFHNLHYLNNPNMKQNTIDLSQLTVLPDIHHVDAEIIVAPKMENEDRLKNHRLSYEVTEPESSEMGEYVVPEGIHEEESEERQYVKRGRRTRTNAKENKKEPRRERSNSHNRGKIRHH